MSTITPPNLNSQISEEAADWFVEFRTRKVDFDQRRRFDVWIRTSPEHLRAYLDIAAIWTEGASFSQRNDLTIDVLTARAIAEGNVVPLSTAETEEAIPREVRAPVVTRAYLRRPLAIAASVGLIVVSAGAAMGWQFYRYPTYSTGVGEQRSVQLVDGSTVELNALSKIKIGFNEKERTVQLLKGQALFRVAREPGRPFTVKSEDANVRAVGTQFDVYRKSTGTVVTVIEGRVAVTGALAPLFETSVDDFVVPGAHPPQEVPDVRSQSRAATKTVPERSGRQTVVNDRTHGKGQGKAILLSAGEQVTVASNTARTRVRANVAATTAWTQRQLVFESATLQDIAEEFNRYSSKRFVVEDEADHNLHLSGNFSSTDLDLLVRFLRERPGISVNETPDEIRISRR